MRDILLPKLPSVASVSSQGAVAGAVARAVCIAALLGTQGTGCSRGGAPGSSDLMATTAPDLAASPLEDLARAGGDAATAPADLAVLDLTLPPDLAGPTAAECFERWRMYGGTCPGPVITQAWAASTGCVGGNPGLFIEGMNFQLEMRNMGIADYGPQAMQGFDQKHWNELTTTRLCVTMSLSYALSFPGKLLSVRNPDGKISNTVTIMRK